MILYLKELSIIQKDDPNNSNNDTVVNLININEGVDGAALFGIARDYDEKIIEGGSTYIPSVNTALDIRVLKPTSDANSAYTGQTDLQQLKDWSNNQTDVYVIGKTLDGVVMFGDYGGEVAPVKLVANEQLSDNDVFAFKITRQSEMGDSQTTGFFDGGFYGGKNLIGMYKWGDASGDNTPNGYAVNLFSTRSFNTVNNHILLTTNAGGGFNRLIYSRTVYPFGGDVLTFSIDVISVNEYGGNISNQIRVREYSADGTVTASTLGSIDASDNGTRVSYDLTLQSDTVSFDFRIFSQEIAAGSQDGEMTLANPCVRIDGNTEYVIF